LCRYAKEFGTHTRMGALSGGQKVKVVIAAAMWNMPHIVILDEPTNYLDRDSLGALAGAIRTYEGGVVMITHNNEFCSALCPETWLMAKSPVDGIARCNCKGDAEVGLYKLNPADPVATLHVVQPRRRFNIFLLSAAVKAPGFEPLHLKCDILVSSLCFHIQFVPLRRVDDEDVQGEGHGCGAAGRDHRRAR
jgi:energy-coupling factor transporter ATP-binding protein EcfA2